MSKRISTIVGAFLLAIGLAVFAGSALAGNGNSAGAPGQEKKATATSSNGNQNSPTQAGVKPANNTAKNTSCTTGGGTGSSATCTSTGPVSKPASGKADASKRYGNGKTAAQIANSRGAPAGTPIKGPGNSQPHKVCGKNGHFVDVHAVKSYSNNCATKAPTSSQSSNVSGAATTQSSGVLGAQATVTQSVSAVAAAAKAVARAHARHGAVLGAVAAVRSKGTLPFTGFPVWAAVLVGLGLAGLGFGLRRVARVRVTV